MFNCLETAIISASRELATLHWDEPEECLARVGQVWVQQLTSLNIYIPSPIAMSLQFPSPRSPGGPIPKAAGQWPFASFTDFPHLTGSCGHWSWCRILDQAAVTC